MSSASVLRFGAQTDEMTSLLRIVNLVRLGEATTRPEIGRVTGLGRGVVSQRVEHAIELGYLEDAELAPSSGGRAPRTLRFHAEQGLLVVCAVGGLHLHVGVTTLDGRILDDAHVDWDVSRGPVETLARAAGLADDLLAQQSPAAAPWAVVVGVPGPVDFTTGRPVAPSIMPGWNGFDVRGRLQEHFGVPVWVDNDVNLLACGERNRPGNEERDLVYFKIGNGIGAGFLSRGRIHRGNNGAAGDIGHVPVTGSRARCRCGKVGCLEAVAGGWALVRDAEAAVADGADGVLADRVAGGGRITPETIARASANGDALAITLVQRAASVAGEALATLVNVFNPAVIVIGGAVAAAGELFLAGVRQRIYELSVPLATRDLLVVNSFSDVREPLRGGAHLAQEQLFEVTFPRWFADGRPTVATIHGASVQP